MTLLLSARSPYVSPLPWRVMAQGHLAHDKPQPPQDRHRVLLICLLQSPSGWHFLMSEVSYEAVLSTPRRTIRSKAGPSIPRRVYPSQRGLSVPRRVHPSRSGLIVSRGGPIRRRKKKQPVGVCLSNGRVVRPEHFNLDGERRFVQMQLCRDEGVRFGTAG